VLRPGTPAGASPTPASGPPASSARDASLVEAILRRVHEERAALGGFLGQASWVEIDDGVLQIAFLDKHAFFREKVEGRESIDYLRRVAREVAGRDLQIRVTIAAPGVADAAGAPPQAAGGPLLAGSPAGPDAGQKQRLKEEAMKQPMMKTLLDTLGGEIVDVESA